MADVTPRWKTGIRRSKRNKAVEYAKARAASIPAGDLVRFAEAIEREEQKLTLPTPPGPSVRDEGEAA